MNYLDAKPGGFNLLNTPDTLYQALGPQRYWDEVNKSFLEAAIKRGDEIVLATRPDHIALSNSNGVATGFGKEYDFLINNGYQYDALSGRMLKGGINENFIGAAR